MRATVCDVGPRDGLQSERETLAPGTRAELVERLARAGLPRRRPDATAGPATATVSVAFGCPFEGPVDPDGVVALADQLADADELVLADTIGVATPTQVKKLIERVAKLGRPVGAHPHNTRNTGYANAYTALEGGAEILDASVGGLGGCPFAPRATGNVATEDLVYMLEGDGVATGVDLAALIHAAEWLESLLGRQFPGQLYRAGLP